MSFIFPHDHTLTRNASLETAGHTLYVEYAKRGNEYGILFMFSLFCESIHLDYVRIHVIYRGNQAEHVIHILVVAPQEYVNVYSTRMIHTHAYLFTPGGRRLRRRAACARFFLFFLESLSYTH